MADQCVHHWIVDNMNVGRCQLCGAEKDFGALLRKSERKAVSQTRSEAANKRWSDPEYREKQSASRQSPEYQVKQIAARKKRWQEHRANRGLARATEVG
jgi:hypothetical protein